VRGRGGVGYVCRGGVDQSIESIALGMGFQSIALGMGFQSIALGMEFQFREEGLVRRSKRSGMCWGAEDARGEDALYTLRFTLLSRAGARRSASPMARRGTRS